MYKLYITFLFIISLSAFHQIESVNVTLKNSVNDDNSFKIGDDIHLSCKCDLEPKYVLTSVKINFGAVWIYDNNHNGTTQDLNEFSKVMDHGLKNNEALIVIHNATKGVEGDYRCVVGFKKEDNTTDTKTSDTFKISNWEGGDVKDFKFNIHLRSDEKKVKDFKKGDNVVIKCTPNVTDPEVVSIELYHNKEKIYIYEVKGKTPNQYHQNTNITDKDIEYTPKSEVEIEILKINEKMGGEYLCKAQIKNGDKHYTESSKPLDIGNVTGGTAMLNFSFALIVVSLISTRFSYSK